MPCADWVNFSAASEKVVAVDWAALVRPVSASVRWRMVASVVAVASAPPATEFAALELPDHRAQLELEQFEDFPGGIAVRSAGSVCRNGRQRRLRLNRRRSRFRQTFSQQAERHRGSLEARKCERHCGIGA